jgi:uncharacterized membrane protein YfcA
MPITELVFYLAAVPAVLVVGISKGGFGGGLALVGVPLMSLVIAPAQAAAIMLPILITMDAIGIGAYWRRFEGAVLRSMLPGGVFGIAVGGLLFGALDAATMRLIIGTIALLFVAHHFLGRRLLAPEPSGGRAPNAAMGAACGALSGFTSTLAHAGGPPAHMYLLPLRLDKTVFVATSVVFFAVVNLVKLVPYWWIGQFATGNLWTSLVLAPLAPVGMLLGIWLHKRVDQALFYRLAYLFVAITGLKLIYDGLA